jgi:uncharacterized protein
MLGTGLAAERAVSGRRAGPPQFQTVRSEELQLSILVRLGDSLAGRPLYCEIIDRARHAGLRGATAVRGLQGVGASGKLRSAGLTGPRGSEPVLIEITDDEARVLAFLPVLDGLVGSGLAMLRPVTVMRQIAVAPGMEATAAP